MGKSGPILPFGFIRRPIKVNSWTTRRHIYKEATLSYTWISIKVARQHPAELPHLHVSSALKTQLLVVVCSSPGDSVAPRT